MRSALATDSYSSPTTQRGRAELQRALESLVRDVPLQQHLAASFTLLHERCALRHDIVGAGRAVKAIADLAVLRSATEEKISRLTWLLHDPIGLPS